MRKFVVFGNCVKKLTKLLTRRCFHGSAVVRGLLFVFGGSIDIHWSSSTSVEFMDVESGQQWHKGPEIPSKVRLPEVTSMEQDVYLLHTEDNVLLKLNVERKSWSQKLAIPGVGWYGARMIQVKDKLCVVGGYNNMHAWYTPSTDTWLLSATKPSFCHAHGALLYRQNTIFIIGGCDQKKVESYDLDTGVWSVCDWEMPKAVGFLHGLMLG